MTRREKPFDPDVLFSDAGKRFGQVIHDCTIRVVVVSVKIIDKALCTVCSGK